MKKYDNIQILRVLSCLGVFIAHLAPRLGATGHIASAANFCASGVYLFFVISGFLACCAKNIRPGSGWRSVLAYYCRRMLRILPLYYAVIVYNMVLHCLLLKDVPADPAGLFWLRYFFLTNAFIPGPDNFWSNLSATWTISLFVFFYLCAPLFVRLIEGKTGKADRTRQTERKNDRTERKSGRTAVCAPAGDLPYGVFRAALLYLAALFLRYIWVAAGLSSYMMLFYYLHYFILGMLVWEMAAAYRPAEALLRFAVFVSVLGGVLRISGAGNDYFTVVSWFYAALILMTGGFSWKKENAASGSYCPTRPQQLTAMAGSRGHFGAKESISARIVRMIGVLDTHSYAVYLVHAVVIDGIVLLQAHMQLPGIAVLLLAVGLTAVGAYLAHLLIEKPAEKLGRRLVARLKI